jgi:hypothetical protein
VSKGLDDGSWLRRQADLEERFGNKAEADRMRRQADGVRQQYQQKQKEENTRISRLSLLVWAAVLASPMLVLLILGAVPSWLWFGLLPSLGLVAVYVIGRLMADE